MVFKKHRRLKGLCPTLKKYFYPLYEPSRAIHPTRACHSLLHASNHTKAQRRSRAEPKRRGTWLDGSLTRTVQWFHDYRLHPQHLISTTLTLPPAVPERVRNAYAKRSLDTRKIWSMMFKYGLTPIGTQVGVGSLTLGVATSVDLVCLDRDKKYVLIEIKSGYETGYEDATEHTMNHPFQHRSDCEFHQHQLQLAGTRMLYQLTFPHHTLGTCRLWRVHTRGIDSHPLMNWAIEARDEMFRVLQTPG